jgi:hypothetical protein
MSTVATAAGEEDEEEGKEEPPTYTKPDASAAMDAEV